MSPVRVSLYIHAWQAVLMFVAGLIAVVASFVGYLRTGGGEDLLRQVLPLYIQEGTASFDSSKLDLAESTFTVIGLRHSGLGAGLDRVSGLKADQFSVKLDLWPWQWPPRVEWVEVHGMKELMISVEEGFLQRSELPKPKIPSFPIRFDGVKVVLKAGTIPPIVLEDCSGTLQGLSQGQAVGRFALERLNGRPFHFTLAARDDGRWECSGSDLEIDTQPLQVDPAKLKIDKFDPVELLVRALLTGESGAKGTIKSLRVVVQPKAEGREFECEGQVGYRNLELRLPAPETQAAVALPHFLDWMLWGEKSLWPKWLMADAIRTGADGRLTFHMIGKRLEFACDEGSGSAFIARADGRDLEPLEGLKGSIQTDDDYRPCRIVLRAFLGDQLRTEVQMRRDPDGMRVYDVGLEPRAASSEEVRFGEPLWRFRSRVEDFTSAPAGKAGRTLLKFDFEGASMHFPNTLVLPPGIRNLSGQLRVQGRYAADGVLVLDRIDWRDGGLVFGGPLAAEPHPLVRKMYPPLLDGLKRLWGGGPAEWRLQDAALTARTEVRLDEKGRWRSTELKDGKLAAGRLVYRGLTTDLGAANIRFHGRYAIGPGAEEPPIRFLAEGDDPKDPAKPWSMELSGRLSESGDGELKFAERGVPRDLHPERESISSKHVRGVFHKTVERTTILRVQEGKASREVLP